MATLTDKLPASRDPLHGMTLEKLLNALVADFGWQGMAQQVNINCFKQDPSIKSSLTFLRRTPWARQAVEKLYLEWVAGRVSPDNVSGGDLPPLSPRKRTRSVVERQRHSNNPWENHPLVKKSQ
jgi:uncharacterized protein (DUF2132 family)